MKRTLVVVAVILAAAGRGVITPRLTHIPSPEMSYEAFAHLLCGGLIAIHLYDRSQKVFGYLGWGLAVWELCWFLVQKVLS